MARKGSRPRAKPRSRAATKAQLGIIAEEEGLLERVRAGLRQAAARPMRGRAGGGGEFETLREELFEARDEDEGVVLGLMYQQAARDGTAALDTAPDLQAPYFAHLRLRTAGRVRDVLLGPRAFPGLGPGLSIVDWRRAPITEVFFSCREGDDYELEIDERALEGEVEVRRVLSFTGGQLDRVSVSGGTVHRTAKGWRFEPAALGRPLTGAPAAPLARQLAAGASSAGPLGIELEMLDPQQQGLLDLDPEQPLLILGSAGCGKTTVALHRLARLCSRWPERFPPRRSLVVVPERGLRRLGERLLDELGLGEAQVRTFDEWVATQARALFSWLPARRAPDTPQAVSKLKRHPALFAAIDRLIDEEAARLAAQLDRKLRLGTMVQDAMADRFESVLARRLRRVEQQIVKAVPKGSRKRVEAAFRAAIGRLSQVREDVLRLIGDRALLELAAEVSGGALGAHHVEATLAHTNRQLDDPAALRYAHVDPERLKPVDGRDIDDGTPDDLAHTVDDEDFAIALELLFRKTGKTATRARKLERVAQLVVDEAQELSPIELRVLGRAVKARGGAVTVAGDAAQQVDLASDFSSWDKALAALGVPDAASSCLETTYRCPRPVAELAHQVLGPLAPAEAPRAVRDGSPVSRTAYSSEGHAAVALSEALLELGATEPQACVAVIARDATGARGIHQVLSRSLDARLVLEGEFSFAPGIEVTEVAQVKGLEFDYVVVPDASVRHYPDRPEARRMLHVAVTRAAHQVWIVSPGSPSTILPA